jgi:hypothetical protein
MSSNPASVGSGGCLRRGEAALRDLFLAVDPRSSEARAVAIRTDLLSVDSVRPQQGCADGAHCENYTIVFPGPSNDARRPRWRAFRLQQKARLRTRKGVNSARSDFARARRYVSAEGTPTSRALQGRPESASLTGLRRDTPFAQVVLPWDKGANRRAPIQDPDMWESGYKGRRRSCR